MLFGGWFWLCDDAALVSRGAVQLTRSGVADVPPALSPAKSRREPRSCHPVLLLNQTLTSLVIERHLYNTYHHVSSHDTDRHVPPRIVFV